MKTHQMFWHYVENIKITTNSSKVSNKCCRKNVFSSTKVFSLFYSVCCKRCLTKSLLLRFVFYKKSKEVDNGLNRVCQRIFIQKREFPKWWRQMSFGPIEMCHPYETIKYLQILHIYQFAHVINLNAFFGNTYVIL